MGQILFCRRSKELESWTSFLERWKNSNVFIYWWSNSNTLFLALNKWTSNLIELSIYLLNYLSKWLGHHFFEHRRNSNVFIYWIELEHPIFGFERSNFDHSSTHHYKIITLGYCLYFIRVWTISFNLDPSWWLIFVKAKVRFSWTLEFYSKGA